jgi:hypothetical protein
MEGLDVLDANEPFQLFKRSVVCLLSAHVVTLRKAMACIVADSNPVLVVHLSDDLTEIFKFPANDIVAASLTVRSMQFPNQIKRQLDLPYSRARLR